MKIRKASWHYKAIAWCDWYPSTNLCTYFWQVVAACIMIVGVCIGIGLIGCFVLLVIGSFISLPVMCYLDYADIVPIGSVIEQYSFVKPIVELGVVSWVISMSVLCYLSVRRISRYVSNSPESDGLLASYAKAKKDKVCPMIEFE